MRLHFATSLRQRASAVYGKTLLDNVFTIIFPFSLPPSETKQIEYLFFSLFFSSSSFFTTRVLFTLWNKETVLLENSVILPSSTNKKKKKKKMPKFQNLYHTKKNCWVDFCSNACAHASFQHLPVMRRTRYYLAHAQKKKKNHSLTTENFLRIRIFPFLKFAWFNSHRQPTVTHVLKGQCNCSWHFSLRFLYP